MFAVVYFGLFALIISHIEATPTCASVEILTSDGPTCTVEPTCKNPLPQPELGCREKYNREMCKCIDGYIRDGTVKNKCIPDSECVCPKGLCGENEFCNICAKECQLQPTCDNPFPKSCEDNSCDQRCECKPGYIRNSEQKCILLSECPNAVCGPNKFLNKKATKCDILQTCETPTIQKPTFCEEPTTYERCDCIPGYVLLRNGTCVSYIEECGVCGPGEKRTSCMPCCEPTCQEPDVSNCGVCYYGCKNGCVCEEGLTRDAESNLCVPFCSNPHGHPHFPGDFKKIFHFGFP